MAAEQKKTSDARYYAANPERWLASGAKRRAMHPKEIRAYKTKWDAAHPGYAAIASAKWRAAHPAQKNAETAAWRKAKLGYSAYLSAMRRAKEALALPLCANLEKVYGVYEDAAILTRETGTLIEVDHIKSLKHGGLHYWPNLQLRTEAQHAIKTREERVSGRK
jgi:hypothetical protein